GLSFAYHNHEFEFEPTDGVVPYDILLADTDPSLVKMELDLYWATVGGQDPVAMFERHPGRFPLWHVKDARGSGSTREQTAVGEGTIDFRRIFDHGSQAGVQHMFVEADEPADPLALVRTSYENVRRLLG
ncbi:MAG TPA: sugar phosphate isomerase/epimerase, partial [Gemmatimonadaceae bacterium]